MSSFPWFDVARLGFEAQYVVALRLTRLAAGGAIATREANRMVTEKAAALMNAQLAAATALAAGGGPERAAERAFATYRKAVRKNRRRLTRRR